MAVSAIAKHRRIRFRFAPTRDALPSACSRTIFTSSILSLKNKGFCNPVISSLCCPLLRFAAATSLTSLACLDPIASRRCHRSSTAAALRVRFADRFEDEAVATVTRFGVARGERGAKPARRGAYATICAPNGINRKQCERTKACEKNAITAACYLCNTLPKTAVRTPSRAVPLLRVQKPSVIVMLRRRGASRGRPVFRWFA
jgi:hypothetical protein